MSHSANIAQPKIQSTVWYNTVVHRVIFQPACSPDLNPRDTWAWNAINRELFAVRNRISLKAEAGCCAPGNSLSGCVIGRSAQHHFSPPARVRRWSCARRSFKTSEWAHRFWQGKPGPVLTLKRLSPWKIQEQRLKLGTRPQFLQDGFRSLASTRTSLWRKVSHSCWYLRHVSALGGSFHTDSLNVHRYWTSGPEYSTRRQVICASTWRWIWEHIDDIGTHLIQVEWVKGHPTMQLVQAGTTSLWQLHAKELADEQAKKGSALHPIVAKVEQSHSARTSFLGWLAKFLGRLHRQRWRFRAHVSRLARSVNGKHLQKHIHTPPEHS